MKKPASLLFLIITFAMSLSATTGFTLGAVVVSDYGRLPEYRDLLSSPFGQRSFEGFQWEVTLDHFGFGGTYAAAFSKDPSSDWWLDWYGIPLSLRYHLFEFGDFLDPFFEAGLGSGGRVYVSPGSPADPRLSIGIFPALAAGLNIDLRPLVLGGTLTWVPGISEIPCTPIPGYDLGGVQIAFSLGLRFGSRD